MEDVKVMSPYTSKDYTFFRKLILQKKEETCREIERLMGSVTSDSRATLDNDSEYSLHLADSAAICTCRESVYVMVERLRKLLNYLDRALDRIDNGTYGICRVTGKPIPRERLEVIPHTDLSVEGKMREQRGF